MPLTTEEFNKHLVASGLLSEDAVAEFLAALPADAQPTDGEHMAKEHVRRKKVTKGKFEVTRVEWKKSMGSTPREVSRAGNRKRDVEQLADAQLRQPPVAYFSPKDCCDFLAKLNERTSESGWQYRLPMLDEWDYVLRGGAMKDPSVSVYDCYVGQPSHELLSGKANAGIDGSGRPTPVGSYPPNPLGLNEVIGNSAEIMHDEFRPQPGFKLPHQVATNGIWVHEQGEFRAAQPTDRIVMHPLHNANVIRFHVARVQKTSPPDSLVPSHARAHFDAAPARVSRGVGKASRHDCLNHELGRREEDLHSARRVPDGNTLRPSFE